MTGKLLFTAITTTHCQFFHGRVDHSNLVLRRTFIEAACLARSICLGWQSLLPFLVNPVFLRPPDVDFGLRPFVLFCAMVWECRLLRCRGYGGCVTGGWRRRESCWVELKSRDAVTAHPLSFSIQRDSVHCPHCSHLSSPCPLPSSSSDPHPPTHAQQLSQTGTITSYQLIDTNPSSCRCLNKHMSGWPR
jgi:hypothetical protein